MQLKDLAETVGLPLFDVIGRRVHLTEAGRSLAETARVMLNEWSGFTQEIDGMRGLTRGRLSVAVVSTAKYFVPSLLAGLWTSGSPRQDRPAFLSNPVHPVNPVKKTRSP